MNDRETADTKGLAYEAFMTFGLACSNEEHEAHSDFMKQLVWAEEGVNTTGESYGQLLGRVKYNMLKATRAALKNLRMSEADYQKTQGYVRLITAASSSDELAKVCNEGLGLFERNSPKK